MTDSPTLTHDDALADALAASGRHTAAPADDQPTAAPSNSTTAGASVRPQPQDHLPSKADRQRDADLDMAEFKATLPPLKDPLTMRVRDRNGIMRLALKLDAFSDDGGGIEMDTSDPRMIEMLDVLADFDDWAEQHLALDVEAYRRWAATGDVYGKLGDLLGMYGQALGESVGSSS